MRLTEASIGVHVGDGTVKPHVFPPIDDTGPGYAPGDILIALHVEPGQAMGAIFLQGHPDALGAFLATASRSLTKFRTDTGR